jgi:hypothetical protein
LKDVSLHGGYADIVIRVVHCELDGWQFFKNCCRICHPWWVKVLWTLLAKFVLCRTPEEWLIMTGGGNTVNHESLYNDSGGIYWSFTSSEMRYLGRSLNSHMEGIYGCRGQLCKSTSSSSRWEFCDILPVDSTCELI